MASRQLGTLYRELQRAFDARPTDLKKCGALLAQLKVSLRAPSSSRRHRPNETPKIGLIQTGLLIPTAESNFQDLVVARRYPQVIHLISHIFHTGDILEIGAFCSIRAKDVPSFDRYFSQLQSFYTDFRSGHPSLWGRYLSLMSPQIRSPSLETRISGSRVKPHPPPHPEQNRRLPHNSRIPSSSCRRNQC